MGVKRYMLVFSLAIIAISAALYFYGDAVLFNLVYFALFLFASFRALQSTGRKRSRAFIVVTYFIVFVLQSVFYLQLAAGYEWSEAPIRKLLAVLFILLPLIISRYVTVGKYSELYFPTLQETVTISFSQMKTFTGRATQTAALLRKSGDSLSPENFRKIISDLPRHDSFRYVNAGSLTDEYFKAAEETLDDCNLYIVISNTGAPASEIVSVFTLRKFNHASIAFDAELKTIVSYNGGERISPPGLNREVMEYFYQKSEASILIYRLPVTVEQKRAAIDKIAQINSEGSAYNMMGLFINRSYKPNIMYCSQFVYRLLKHIGAAYFEEEWLVKPTDFIEKDYFRKLSFVEELKLNNPDEKEAQLPPKEA